MADSAYSCRLVYMTKEDMQKLPGPIPAGPFSNKLPLKPQNPNPTASTEIAPLRLQLHLIPQQAFRPLSQFIGVHDRIPASTARTSQVQEDDRQPGGGDNEPALQSESWCELPQVMECRHLKHDSASRLPGAEIFKYSGSEHQARSCSCRHVL